MSKKEKIFYMITGVVVYKSWKWFDPIATSIMVKIKKELESD